MPYLPGQGSGLSSILAQENEIARQQKEADDAMTKMLIDMAIQGASAAASAGMGAAGVGGGTMMPGGGSGNLQSLLGGGGRIGAGGGYNFMMPRGNLFGLGGRR